MVTIVSSAGLAGAAWAGALCIKVGMGKACATACGALCAKAGCATACVQTGCGGGACAMAGTEAVSILAGVVVGVGGLVSTAVGAKVLYEQYNYVGPEEVRKRVSEWQASLNKLFELMNKILNGSVADLSLAEKLDFDQAFTQDFKEVTRTCMKDMEMLGKEVIYVYEGRNKSGLLESGVRFVNQSADILGDGCGCANYADVL